MSKHSSVCLMLKAPVAGQVKTRLGSEIGMGVALQVYEFMVRRQLEAIPEGWHCYISYAPKEKELEMKEWLGEKNEYIPQVDGNLGDRLIAAGQEVLAKGEANVFMLGGDCPELTGSVLENAEGKLKQCDLVIGPADDGGYYLIGYKLMHEGLFQDIDWSTEKVLPQTLAKAEVLGLKVDLLETLSDVDTLDSLLKAKRYFPDLVL